MNNRLKLSSPAYNGGKDEHTDEKIACDKQVLYILSK